MSQNYLQLNQYELTKKGRFPVHRVIVYPHAAVKAACEKGFMVSAVSFWKKQANSVSGGDVDSSVLSIEEFEPSTVGLLREYLYTGDYVTEHEKRDDHGAVILANNPGISQALILHLHVAAIADYFDIQPLRNLVHSKVNKALDMPWSSEGFGEVVNLVFEGNDEFLRNQMATTVFNHLDDFIRWDHPAQLFANDLFRRVFDPMQNSRRAMEREIKNLSDDKAALTSRLDIARIVVTGYQVSVVSRGFNYLFQGTCVRCGQTKNYNYKLNDVIAPQWERCRKL
ncbi:hypothetical protein ASPACDRAFT_64732 [Aspergillus aculeatus ATCC 16872]|uniref:BTB domain-containing protein n=1 Tax=Aspergillus aculeatus (strain ATCC 16872 / CBS 172.66 / WB 5094) TaxID=690307 RepID=A0A1L9WGA4_ASPA1|nr:uncharacterized protein ASPACDRAFT_64732 [Aspergillus aculeatus ATCC 16872]OJJ95135.1 hypothetical protein ASPACDRAFT_64732 [Aspergillus aculeatus ATCC 16872]